MPRNSELSGNVPKFYRDCYVLITTEEGQIDRDFFIALYSDYISKETLIQIWDLIENYGGYLTETGFFKGFALIAISQLRRPISTESLDLYRNKDLPIPSIGDLDDIRSQVARVQHNRNPCLLKLTFREVTDTDTISVSLLEETKGFLLKYNEYEVKSRRFNSCVLRRYSDFHVLHQLLVQKYPYRIIPEVPPKRLLSQIDKNFLDKRKRHLHHFLCHMTRHPVICDDELMKFFLTYQGGKVEETMKETFKNSPDEFMTNQYALKAKELVAPDAGQQLECAKSHLLTLYRCVGNLKELSEKMASHTRSLSDDLLAFSDQITSLTKCDAPVSQWATGHTKTWSLLQPGLQTASEDLRNVSAKALDQYEAEKDGVIDPLDLFLSLLQGYKNLLERQERGVLADHKAAISKMSSYKKKQMLSTVSGPGAQDQGEAEKLEERIIQLETQLVHVNLDLLHLALVSMVKVNLIGHREMTAIWQQLLPHVESMLPSSNQNG